MDWLTVLLIFVLYCSYVSLNNVDSTCKPRPIVKEIDSVTKITNPRTITLYECSGYSGDEVTRNEKCVPTMQKLIPQKYKLDIFHSRSKNFYNHTECGMKCVCTLDGHKCDKDDLPSYGVPCPEELTWSSSECKCIPAAPCTGNKKVGDSSVNISVGVLIASLVGELVAIATILFLFKNYKSGGCSYKTRIPSTSNNDNSDEEATILYDTSSKREHNESVSGTIINHFDVNQNGGHR